MVPGDYKKSARWAEGLRPAVFGDVWDAMSHRSRCSAFFGDLLVAAAGATFVYWLFA